MPSWVRSRPSARPAFQSSRSAASRKPLSPMRSRPAGGEVEARPGRPRLAVVGEGDRRVLARPLRRDEREVGLADELLLRARVDREGGDACRQRLADEVLGDRAPDPLGELDPRGGLAVDDDGELVAADAERLLAGAALVRQRARELPQDAVAGRVALLVVQALEVVEVAKKQRDL